MQCLFSHKSRESGAVSTRMLAVILIIAVAIGFVVWRLRPPAADSNAGVPAAPPEMARTNLVLVEGRLRLPGTNTPFTGLMLEHSANGALRSRSAVSNGLLHGLSEGWYTNAQIQVSEHFKEGVSHGVRTKWYASGAKQSEASIVDGKLHGTFRKWHENQVLSEQVEFVNDQPEGLSLAYFPSGYLKARVTLRNGQPTEQTFWKDGEKKE
ncbi:MAG: toxin-antitoxin system YwqK family antitoxin [Verrucomicrobia bacterium]|nr:toxin-antitoxin system YwqK family antitoxin [Verrucomicrobiota bacterium]